MREELRRQMEEEKKERMGNAYNNAINANIKLQDKLKWIKEDIEREIYKITTHNISIEEIIEDLKIILKNNN